MKPKVTMETLNILNIGLGRPITRKRYNNSEKMTIISTSGTETIVKTVGKCKQ